MSDTEGLSLLGNKVAQPDRPEDAEVECIPWDGNLVCCRFTCPEFTSLCPITGQPDFATIRISYVANERCLELKSLKLYLQSFRNRGVFHEAVTNEILDHLVASCRPRRMKVVGEFNARGGISTVVTAEYPKPGAMQR